MSPESTPPSPLSQEALLQSKLEIMEAEKAGITKHIVGLSTRIEGLLTDRNTTLQKFSDELSLIRNKVAELATAAASVPSMYQATLSVQNDIKHVLKNLDAVVLESAHTTKDSIKYDILLSNSKEELDDLHVAVDTLKQTVQDNAEEHKECSSVVTNHIKDISLWRKDTVKPKLEKFDRMRFSLMGVWTVVIVVTVIGGFVLKAIDSYNLAHPPITVETPVKP